MLTPRRRPAAHSARAILESESRRALIVPTPIEVKGEKMSSQPIPSALNASTQAFPVLTDAQINRIHSVGKPRRVEKGEILFEPGDTNIPFFVLLSGSMEIVQPSFEGERAVAKHGPGEFTGEMTMISGRHSLARGRVTQAGEFLEVSGDDLRSLVARDAELSEIFMRAFILRRLQLVSRNQGNVVLLGSRHSANTLRLREFLTRNEHPYTYVDLDADKSSEELLDRFNVKAEEIPVVVVCNARYVLRNPSMQEVADSIGLNSAVDQSLVRDLVIVGAGPSGLAAAVYAASEGLDVLVIEEASPGGQAGSSSKIENYLGFPTGLSGQELVARAIAQTEKFGAKIMVAHSVARLDCARRPYKVILDNGNKIAARSVVIASGAQYNKPPILNLPQFEGRGIYYGATYMESQLCEGEDVVVVGGGNSAGQAAVFLSQTAHKVYMLVRSGNLSDSMSRYLIQRIEENPGIELHFKTEIVGLEGDAQLERVTWKDKATGETTVHNIRHVFIMAGASPRTEWLKGCLALDNRGFILTGRDLNGAAASTWKLSRSPQMLETSLPGIFAVGDARSGSVKRVASAVGEGSIAVYLVHRALAEL
jgi:thioredoxin reductase (NADPH)